LPEDKTIDHGVTLFVGKLDISAKILAAIWIRVASVYAYRIDHIHSDSRASLDFLNTVSFHNAIEEWINDSASKTAM